MNLLWAGTQESLETYLKQEAETKLTAEAAGVDLKAYNESLDPFSDDEVEPVSPLLTVTGGVGIITIAGTLVTEDSWVNSYLGRTSYGEIQRAAMVAAARTDVNTILLDITSPGGNVIGARETMLTLKAVGKEKPLIAFAEMAASSSYWLASTAQKRYISATGIGGSIGVVARHVEYSKMNEKEGIKETVLRAGQYKQLMNSSEPLTDAAVTETMRLLDESYRVFVQDVSTNLGVPFAQIDNVAQGREYLGQQAVDAGLFNKVSDFQEVLAALVITEEEGGSIVNKNKSLTYSMASAFAASAAGRELQDEVTPEEGVEQNADAGEVVEEASVEVTPEEQLELDLKASQERVAELEATVAEAKTAAEESTAVMEAAHATITELSKIVAQAVGNMSVALNVENPLDESSDPAAILAAYKEKTELFAAQFPAGGVAAVEEDPEPVQKAGPTKSRFDVARFKQTVTPRS